MRLDYEKKCTLVDRLKNQLQTFEKEFTKILIDN